MLATHGDRPATAMHHTLRIAEVFDMICTALRRSRKTDTSKPEPSLAALAQTCRAFKETALDLLWYDLDSIRQSLPELSKTTDSKARNAGFAFDESRMRTHLCDVQECAGLMHFALGVCQR